MEAQEFTYTTGCKINIGLRVYDILPNGYHRIHTLLYPISNPSDTLIIKEDTTKHPCIVHCTEQTLEKENILHKTHTLIMEYAKQNNFSLPFSYTLSLEKKIPIGAGLGGGSADAGAFLSYFGNRFKEYFPLQVLHDIASKLGADVPFFLYKEPCYAHGIGTSLEKSEFLLHGMYCMILEFSHKINTSNAYKELDNFRKKCTNSLTTKNNYSKRYPWLALMGNDFEDILFQSYPNMRQCKEKLLLNGAVLAGVSGSGSSMFGIFRTEKERSDAEISVQNIVDNLYLSNV